MEKLGEEKQPSLVVKHLSGFIIAFVALSGWSYFNWNEMQKVTKVHNDFLQQEYVKKGKDAERELELSKRKNDLDAREKNIHEHELALNGQVSQVASERLVNNEQVRKVNEMALQISAANRQVAVDGKIENLMTQISQLGVDLNRMPDCNNVDGIKRFRQGKLMLEQIRSLANGAGLLGKYRYYLDSNSTLVSHYCD